MEIIFACDSKPGNHKCSVPEFNRGWTSQIRLSCYSPTLLSHISFVQWFYFL